MSSLSRVGPRAVGGGLRQQLIGLGGVVERNTYPIKRYAWWELAFFIWTVANTLTIVFIAKGVQATGGQLDVRRVTTSLLIGAVIWSYLGIIFEILTETVAWERWEGTIEYTFMAPLSRAIHLGGMGLFAVLYGVVRTALLFAVVALFFDLHLHDADFVTALVLLAIASLSFVGVGMVTAVLPLISPEKGAQFGFIAQGLLLVVSGVYYPVSVLPQWMQWLAKISPATYALRGIRAAVLNGASVGSQWGNIWPLLVLGVVAIPLGLAVFKAGERYAKRHGKLKRSGWSLGRRRSSVAAVAATARRLRGRPATSGGPFGPAVPQHLAAGATVTTPAAVPAGPSRRGSCRG
jgi:ABC-2 type transport system permease protein